MSAGFWAVPDVGDVRTPAAMLKEQASALTDATKGLLQAEVATSSESQSINHTLFITAPALSGFRYSVLSYKHTILLYPGTVFIPFRGTAFQVSNEEEFTNLLKNTLSSKEISNVISSLLIQSRDG
ncbi:hypothetical protein LOK46_29630 [Methylobacterium sp. NMS14P]|uniref:hypothetical protein n=1 Tax=Methylobacterium sp. NMS14P TaxID=2894310 RepID=UPI00235885EE|nr:hypothetical protein [Methylobacterium sp. NMS14P]WCS25228.1 hypothetical protein LOK46_29630 [Methylobacterium sp. NMS14P]